MTALRRRAEQIARAYAQAPRDAADLADDIEQLFLDLRSADERPSRSGRSTRILGALIVGIGVAIGGLIVPTVRGMGEAVGPVLIVAGAVVGLGLLILAIGSRE